MPPDPTPPSREALREFLALIEQVDREFLGADRNVTQASDVAAGEHMLLHLIKCGLDTWVDNDASRPRFAPLASAVLKWGGEGADNPSHLAPLDPTRRYRITGRMRDEAYISFTIYTGKQEGDFNDGVVSALNHTQFPRDAEGRFSIDILPAPREGALHMQPGKPNCVIARHYFERATCAMADPRLVCEIDIECLDEPGHPRPLSPPALADKLRAAMTFIHSQTLARGPQDPSKTPPGSRSSRISSRSRRNGSRARAAVRSRSTTRTALVSSSCSRAKPSSSRRAGRSASTRT